MKKLKQISGETLIESLVSILLVALSALLLAQMTAASSHFNRNAQQTNHEYHEALSAAEEATNTEPGQIQIIGSQKTYTYRVELSPHKGAPLISYEVAP